VTSPVRLILIGPPGSGKGTQGAALAKQFGVRHISSGDLLRAHVEDRTELGRRIAGHLDSGELAPDALVTDVVADALANAGAAGYVLEGFPRNLAQAERLDDLTSGDPADAVVYLDLADDVARERLTDRATEGRTDDRDAEVIARRLREFHAETEPVVEHYRARGTLTTVDGDQSPEAVTAQIVAAV
jgi:adenylate kinase